MIYQPMVSDTERHFAEVYQDYQKALQKVGRDPVARAGVNLRWQGWRGKFRRESDPYYGTPVSRAMLDQIEMNCSKLSQAPQFTPSTAPGWVNKVKGVHTCGYCRKDNPITHTHKTDHKVLGIDL